MTDAVLDFGVGFKGAGDRLTGERAERLERAKKILPFGVSFLDDAFGGIFPNDLIVLGAKTGAGKTAIATAIAHKNVLAGKHVHYFALEAEDREIERRMKYREISDLVYRSSISREIRQRFNFVDWYAGNLDAVLGPDLEAGIDAKVAKEFKTLHTYYRKSSFSVDDLSRLFLAIQDETDLIILDHLHYVDIEDQNENRGLKDAIKRIRDISVDLGKPVIVVAHLRKSDRRMATLIPDMDDFHGTSDITKIATKCLLLSKARDQESDPQQPHLWPTYISIPKFRMEGSRSNYAALIPYNVRLHTYEDEYILGRFNIMATEFESIRSQDRPFWAKRAS